MHRSGRQCTVFNAPYTATSLQHIYTAETGESTAKTHPHNSHTQRQRLYTSYALQWHVLVICTKRTYCSLFCSLIFLYAIHVCIHCVCQCLINKHTTLTASTAVNHFQFSVYGVFPRQLILHILRKSLSHLKISEVVHVNVINILQCINSSYCQEYRLQTSTGERSFACYYLFIYLFILQRPCYTV